MTATRGHTAATTPSNSRDPHSPTYRNTYPHETPSRSKQHSPLQVALLTGGGDKPYALGLTSALVSQGIMVDFIGSNEVNGPGLHTNPQVTFLNLRGDQRQDASLPRKVFRVLAYYVHLLRYAALAKPKVFHVLWNNKFQLLDRTLLMLYYRSLRKRIVLTAHNVNAAKRDRTDSWLNRISLRFQYRLAHHIFVHTGRMKTELVSDFGVPEAKVSVIPFGINDTVPDSGLTGPEARKLLGIDNHDKTILFFGYIAPYKGLEYLVAAMAKLTQQQGDYRLVIAGTPKRSAAYWHEIRERIARSGIGARIIESIEYIPDCEVEWYFKAADALVLPYSDISQSGVLLLAYSFGLPVIAADVGSLRENIVQGETGFVFRAEDSNDLAETIDTYFKSELYRGLENRRKAIRDYAGERYSWSKVGEITKNIYERLLADGDARVIDTQRLGWGRRG